jgi:hypothetical protein
MPLPLHLIPSEPNQTRPCSNPMRRRTTRRSRLDAARLRAEAEAAARGKVEAEADARGKAEAEAAARAAGTSCERGAADSCVGAEAATCGCGFVRLRAEAEVTPRGKAEAEADARGKVEAEAAARGKAEAEAAARDRHELRARRGQLLCGRGAAGSCAVSHLLLRTAASQRKPTCASS